MRVRFFTGQQHTLIFISISDISLLRWSRWSIQCRFISCHMLPHTTVFNSYSYRTDNRTPFFLSGNVWNTYSVRFFLFILLWSTAISSNCNVLSIFLHSVSYLLGVHRQMSIVFECVNPFLWFKFQPRTSSIWLKSIENTRKVNGNERMNFILRIATLKIY